MNNLANSTEFFCKKASDDYCAFVIVKIDGIYVCIYLPISILQNWMLEVGAMLPEWIN